MPLDFFEVSDPLALAAGGAAVVEVCDDLGLMGGLALAAGRCLAFPNVGAALDLAAGDCRDFFNMAGAFVLSEVGARCAEKAPRLSMADADAWTPSVREGTGVARGSIETGVEEPGGNSNGGSGGTPESLIGGGAPKRLSPPTTVPRSAEWVGISMSAIVAAKPAAARTKTIS